MTIIAKIGFLSHCPILSLYRVIVKNKTPIEVPVGHIGNFSNYKLVRFAEVLELIQKIR